MRGPSSEQKRKTLVLSDIISAGFERRVEVRTPQRSDRAMHAAVTQLAARP
jgi:hypothetical protein